MKSKEISKQLTKIAEELNLPEEKYREDVFRTPDETDGEKWAIWYGPAGKEGDVATTVAIYAGCSYSVAEIQDVTDYVDDVGVNPFLVTSTVIDIEIEDCDSMEPIEALRRAARIGIDHLSQRGGEESFEATLDAAISSTL
jgi:hypothetical protein